MIRFILLLIFMSGVMAVIEMIQLGPEALSKSESMMALGYLLIAAYLAGLISARLNLPKITGYIIAGILAGPLVIQLISSATVLDLSLIDKMALSVIALTAGGEFKLKMLRENYHILITVFLFLIVLVMLAIILAIVAIQPLVPFLADQSLAGVLGIGLLFGIVSVTMSPATTIAIISETRARGKFTDFVLGMTIFCDIAVVLLFSIVLSGAKVLLMPASQFQWIQIGQVLMEMLLSFGVGIAAGGLIYLYLKYVGTEIFLFLVGFILLGIEVAAMLHLELILMFVVAGFVVENFSKEGHQLIQGLESGSLPIYVVFFAITGASLDLILFFQNWFLAFLLVVIRAGVFYGGTYLGGRLTGATHQVKHLGWMGFSGQAGISLGLALLIAQNIPGTVGISIKSLIVAVVTLNQILGPVLFRYALQRAKEIPPSL